MWWFGSLSRRMQLPSRLLLFLLRIPVRRISDSDRPLPCCIMRTDTDLLSQTCPLFTLGTQWIFASSSRPDSDSMRSSKTIQGSTIVPTAGLTRLYSFEDMEIFYSIYGDK
jgi:hypothetical protein